MTTSNKLALLLAKVAHYDNVARIASTTGGFLMRGGVGAAGDLGDVPVGVDMRDRGEPGGGGRGSLLTREN